MAGTLTCPQGHQWEPLEAPGRAGTASSCPICGGAAETISTLGDSELDSDLPIPLPAAVPNVAAAALAGASPVDHQSRPLPDIPGYEILGELGHGGMGVVYKARQVRLKRVVALKMIRTGPFADREHLMRFQAEAEAVARLQHPNIVQVYEVGEHEGCPYLALEFVDGGSLWKNLNGTPLPGREAAVLVHTLAGAIHAAHQQGIIHRDLKPGNILLQRIGTGDKGFGTREKQTGEGRPFDAQSPIPNPQSLIPKITDFGLAKQLDKDVGQTRTGAIMGTPSYMAPEQAAGLGRDITFAADVYALGAILYELLTGRPPFRGATTMDTLEQVRSQEPVAPSRLRPGLPRDLETICLKCLEKDPKRRYAGANTLAEDLRRFLASEPILARPVGALGRTLKWARRRPALAALYGVIALAAVLLVSILSLANVESRRQNTELEKASHQLKESNTQLGVESENHRRLSEKYKSLYYYSRVALAFHEYQANNVPRARQILREDCPPELRHWEWDFVHHLCHAELFTLRGHAGKAHMAVYSPDGKWLASVGDALRLWDPVTGKLLETLPFPGGSILALAFSPDSQHLAGAWSGAKLQASEIRIWNLASRKIVRTLKGHKGLLAAIAYTQDGNRLAVSDQQGFVKIWDLAGGEPKTFRASNTGIKRLAFHPKGHHLATSVPDATVVWNTTATAQSVFRVPSASDVLAYSPDGRVLAVGGLSTEIQLVNSQSGQLLRTCVGHTAAVRSLAFSPDSKRLASASKDNTVRVWNVSTAQVVLTLRGLHDDFINSVAYSPDGLRLVSASDDTTIKIWDALAGQEGHLLKLPHTALSPYNPDAGMVAVGGPDKTVRLWDMRTDREGPLLRGHGAAPHRVAWNADGTRLVTVSSRFNQKLKCQEAEMILWDATNGDLIRNFYGHRNQVVHVTMDPSGRRLASAGMDNTARVWDLNNGSEIQSLQGHAGPVNWVLFHTAGLFTASEDKTIKVWDPASGRELAVLQGHEKGVVTLALSPDGKLLASGSRDHTVRLWNLADSKCLHVLKGHTASVLCLAFSPDGKRLVSGSADKTVRIWDVAMGQEALTLRGHNQILVGVSFSRDGNRLISQDQGDNILVRPAPKKGRLPLPRFAKIIP